jgi:hypothetical protein
MVALMEDTADVLRLKSSAASDECGSLLGERDADPSEERRRAWEVGVGRCETPGEKDGG